MNITQETEQIEQKKIKQDAERKEEERIRLKQKQQNETNAALAMIVDTIC